MKKDKVAIYLPTDAAKALKVCCGLEDESMSEIVEKLIRQSDRLKKYFDLAKETESKK